MSTKSLRQKQVQFAWMVADLIMWAKTHGYELTFGEVKRSQSQAIENAKSGKGISNSLHLISLAVDFNLFKDGFFLTQTSDHEPLGIYWESIGGSWGGRFKSNPDGNHYSLEYNGIK